MFKLIIAIILLAVVLYTMVQYVHKDSEEFVDDPHEEKETPEFPSLDETVQVPPQEEVVKKEYFDLHGVPYEVYTSKEGSKYILRLRTRDNKPYKDYLSENEREKIYEK